MVTAILEFQLKVNKFSVMEILFAWIGNITNKQQAKATFYQIRISYEEINVKLIEANLHVENSSDA